MYGGGRDVSWTFDLNESWHMRPATGGDLIVFMKFLPYLFGLESPLLSRGAIATRALTALCEASRWPECGGA